MFFLSQEYFSKLYFSASVGGIIITLASIVAAWGSFKAQLFIKKFGETKTHLIIGLLYLVCPLAMAWGHPILGIASFGILGFGRGLSMPVFRSSVVSRVCKRKKATFISLMNLFGYLLFAIASPILGKISDTQGVHVALGACFIISVIGMSLVIFIPKIKKLLIPSPIKAGVPVHEV